MGEIFYPAVFRSAAAPTEHEEHEVEPDLSGWEPEQLWLSEDYWSRAARDAMAAAVERAVTIKLAGTLSYRALDHKRLRGQLLDSGQHPASVLRVNARIIRGPRRLATPVGRDLAACLLMIAVLRRDDLLSAIESAAEAHGRAVTLDSDVDDRPLPPGIVSVDQLGGRMRARGRELLAHRITWPDLDTVGPDLARAIANDPVARYLGYGGGSAPKLDAVP